MSCAFFCIQNAVTSVLDLQHESYCNRTGLGWICNARGAELSEDQAGYFGQDSSVESCGMKMVLQPDFQEHVIC